MVGRRSEICGLEMSESCSRDAPFDALTSQGFRKGRFFAGVDVRNNKKNKLLYHNSSVARLIIS